MLDCTNPLSCWLSSRVVPSETIAGLTGSGKEKKKEKILLCVFC